MDSPPMSDSVAFERALRRHRAHALFAALKTLLILWGAHIAGWGMFKLVNGEALGNFLLLLGVIWLAPASALVVQRLRLARPLTWSESQGEVSEMQLASSLRQNFPGISERDVDAVVHQHREAMRKNAARTP